MIIEMSAPRTERNQDATVYVGNLAPEVEEDILYELMVQVAPVTHVKLPKDKISKLHQGFAFVELKTPRDAEYTIKVMNGVQLFGRNLKINRANKSSSSSTVGALGGNSAEIDVGAHLFVGNLDPLVDENLLASTFGHFGRFVRPPMVLRQPTGESKGHGFLYFDSFDASDKVLETMNNQYLMNKQIRIDYALKEDGKHGERHGSEVERLLAKNAKLNNVIGNSPLNTLPRPEQLSQSQEFEQDNSGRSHNSNSRSNRRGANRGSGRGGRGGSRRGYSPY